MWWIFIDDGFMSLCPRHFLLLMAQWTPHHPTHHSQAFNGDRDLMICWGTNINVVEQDPEKDWKGISSIFHYLPIISNATKWPFRPLRNLASWHTLQKNAQFLQKETELLPSRLEIQTSTRRHLNDSLAKRLVKPTRPRKEPQRPGTSSNWMFSNASN